MATFLKFNYLISENSNKHLKKCNCNLLFKK